MEFATRQKAAQEAVESQELNGQMGSFCCQDQNILQPLAAWLTGAGQQGENFQLPLMVSFTFVSVLFVQNAFNKIV